MSSIFNWLSKKWPFISEKDFVCFAYINQKTMPVLQLDVKTELSSPYSIECTVLSDFQFSSSMISYDQSVTVSLFDGNLQKDFSGYLISYSLDGSSATLSDNLSSYTSVNQKYIYTLKLVPNSWYATHNIRTTIYHDIQPMNLIKDVLRPYNIDVSTPVFSSFSENFEVITQYEETDFNFALRLMEQQNSFCYYDFSSMYPVLQIELAQCVGKSLASHSTLTSPSSIHDNFNFNQIINLNIMDKFEYKEVDGRYSKTFSKKFVCECTSYNLFAGNYFLVDYDLFSNYFIEKSVLSLRYDESLGWYIRNNLEGAVLAATDSYLLDRKTVAPKIKGVKKAVICGEYRNSIFVNKFGYLRVRILWNGLPYEENVLDNLTPTFDDVSSFGETLLGMSSDFKINVNDDTSDENASIFDKAEDLDVDVDFGDVVDKLSNSNSSTSIEKAPERNSKAAWSVENSDTVGLTGWIPLVQWSNSGDGYGSYSFPRVGQEVMIDFVNGNPDSPVIIGSYFSLNNQYPFAVMDNNVVTESLEQANNFFDKFKDVAAEVSEFALQQALDLNEIESISAEDISKVIKDTISGICVPQLEPLEKLSITSSAGNLVMRYYSYDSDKNMKTKAWNELTFFNDFAKSSIRLSSSYYVFISSGEIINIEAPKLIREVVGVRSITVNETNNFFCAKESHEFFGANRVKFYTQLDPDSSGFTGTTAARLKTEVLGMITGIISEKTGKIVDANVMSDGMKLFLSLSGDSISILTKGLFSYTALLGAFDVNTNLSTFIILGDYNVTCGGLANFFIGGLLSFQVAGGVDMNSLTGIRLSSIADCSINSLNTISLTASKMRATANNILLTGSKDVMISAATGKVVISALDSVVINSRNFVVNLSGNAQINCVGSLIMSAQMGVSISGTLITLRA